MSTTILSSRYLASNCEKLYCGDQILVSSAFLIFERLRKKKLLSKIKEVDILKKKTTNF
jgi:hypothetical protein